ncbi:MAG TPA: hypothetical protein VFB02_04055 [Bradyrhizobium sp.]|nr:hypothetical protein [Bradyrhizobium sp.]
MKNVTIDGELWSDINQHPAARTHQYSFDLAAASPVHRNLQRDAGRYRATPNQPLAAALIARH